MSLLQELNDKFMAEFPVAKAMGVRIQSVTPTSCELSAPLRLNSNHKGTGFGGSLYSAAVLACYGLFLVALKDQGIKTENLVIAQGEMKYLRPVAGDFRAVASFPEPQGNQDFFVQLQKKGKARTTLVAQILFGDEVCAELQAWFVALN